MRILFSSDVGNSDQLSWHGTGGNLSWIPLNIQDLHQLMKQLTNKKNWKGEDVNQAYTKIKDDDGTPINAQSVLFPDGRIWDSHFRDWRPRP